MSPRSRVIAVALTIAAAAALTAPTAGARVVQTIALKDVAAHEHASEVALGPSGVVNVLTERERTADRYRVRTYSPAGTPLRTRLLPRGADPRTFALDAAGGAWLAINHGTSHEVVRYSAQRQIVARWPAPPAGNAYLSDLIVDGAGNVVAVEGGRRVNTFDPGGRMLSSWSAGHVSSVAVAGSGTILVAHDAGISALDRADGTLRTIVGQERLRRFSSLLRVGAPWGVAAGPDDAIHVLQRGGIEKFSAGGEYLGSVGGLHGARWYGAAVAPDGSIFVARHGGRREDAVLEFAPIRAVDLMAPSLSMVAVAAPGRRASSVGRLRYRLSERADVRVLLMRRARTANRQNRDFGRFLHVGTFDAGEAGAGSHSALLRWSAFGVSRRPAGGEYQIKLVAHDDAGNASRPARASFQVPTAG